MATNSTKDDEKSKTTVDQGTTRVDVPSDANKAVDATRVHTANSDNESGKEVNADNAQELLTENEIAKRNREVGNIGTEREGDNKHVKGDNFNL